MRIALTLTPPTDLHMQWAAQIGVTDYVARYPTHYGEEPIAGLTRMKQRLDRFGLKLSVVEGYLPSHALIWNTPRRDQCIEELSAVITHMGSLGVTVLCYNWMPRTDWLRTAHRVVTRGGALTNGFDVDKLSPALPGEPCICADQLWENLRHFLRKLVPVAEKAGVALAMHPDDPPLPFMQGCDQIMHTVEGYEQLLSLHDSPANAACFCQGTFAETGIDIPAAIRRLGPRIAYVHFRDVRGVTPRFEETFHDDGQTDMHAAMLAYREVGFTGPMRPDHVPTLAGEDGDGNGYSMLGRLFAVGYMRGLMHAVGVR